MTPHWTLLLTQALPAYKAFKERSPDRKEFYYGGHYISCLEIEDFITTMEKEKELQQLYSDIREILLFMVTASSGPIKLKCEYALERLNKYIQ